VKIRDPRLSTFINGHFLGLFVPGLIVPKAREPDAIHSLAAFASLREIRDPHRQP
jgi:hypothetical protein